MRSLLIAALALTVGVLLARAWWGRAPADPVTVKLLSRVDHRGG